MRRPRLLLDLTRYHPADGGFATAVHHLLASTSTFDDIDVVAVALDQFADALRQHGTHVASIHAPMKARSYVGLLAMPLLARRFGADALHAEIGALPYGMGIRSSVTAHDLHFLSSADQPPGGLSGLNYRLYWRHLYVSSLKRATLIKAISRATATAVTRAIGDSDRIRLAYPRVDPGDPTTGEGTPVEGRELNLLFLGSVVPRRNLPFLLDALRLVKRPWRLNIVGQVWWGARELGTVDPRVTFHGFVPDPVRDGMLRQADVLICPSWDEGFGYPVAEAMAYGTFVLASDIPVFREYVPAECRFSLNSPVDLAAKIESLDATSMADLKSSLIDAIRPYSRERHAEAHHAFFRELLGLASPQSFAPPPG
ncbi:MAG: hypothetical protein CVU47_01775 [Chloroflexi bacterium HGW-Chloroflexi-9]|nr:MAG: hypothetical protein CVU47_01775 [Chloroflexi bacterium HGW-Chloroflexi-9]